MNRSRVQKKEINQGWLTTYSDMVTLILSFFVLLYSYSIVDAKKFQAIANSLSEALNGGKQTVYQLDGNIGDTPLNVVDTPQEVTPAEEDVLDSYKDIYNTVTQFVDENSLGDFVTIREGDRGIIIEFRDRILFDTGEANIKDEGIPALMKISELIRNMKNPIVIEGHTDNVPIHTGEFPSNWALSSARAMKVLTYLTDNRGLDPSRFSTAAYGEYSPIASNDTPDGRAQNRRVNILIVTPRVNS